MANELIFSTVQQTGAYTGALTQRAIHFILQIPLNSKPIIIYTIFPLETKTIYLDLLTL